MHVRCPRNLRCVLRCHLQRLVLQLAKQGSPRTCATYTRGPFRDWSAGGQLAGPPRRCKDQR
eukprot:2899920-Alexandrium_andersonii.AAC.1